MGIFRGPNIVRSGLVLALDAADRNSYPGTGTTWNDLSGNGNNVTLTNGPTFYQNNLGNLLFDESKFIQSNTPQIGDIAFWEGHVGIVSKVGKSNKFKLVHAANTRSDLIENPHFINASKYSSGTFYGFFRPVNETPDGKIIDITKDNNLGVAKESMYQSPGLVKDIIVTNKITQPIIIDEN